MTPVVEPQTRQPIVVIQQYQPVVMKPDFFFKRFEDAITIATDEHKLSGESSISSVEIGDCITVFLRGFEQGKVDNIVGYHIDDESTIDDIIEVFKDECFDTSLYDVILIGGNDQTTTGKDCLLANIREAINRHFNVRANIVAEYINTAKIAKTTYVSANLQMGGTFSICYHN